MFAARRRGASSERGDGGSTSGTARKTGRIVDRGLKDHGLSNRAASERTGEPERHAERDQRCASRRTSSGLRADSRQVAARMQKLAGRCSTL